jgi:phytoene dehydrogenase-like protein
MMLTLPIIGFNRGGTHRIAHAAHQALTQLGCKFHITSEVESAIIENGNATGIRLADGTEIAARKLVVSTLSPHQLIFDLIGSDHVDAVTAKRVELLKRNFGCLMWYTLAVHEAPRYTAEAFNPDVHDCGWLGMQPDPDPAHIAKKCQYAQMNMWPPLEDYGVVVGSHSLVDPSYAPPGKHAVYTEQLAQPVSMYSEREWLELRKRYADELMTIWKDYAPNMLRSHANEESRARWYLGRSRPGRMAGRREPAHPRARQPQNADSESLRHWWVLACGSELRIKRIVQLLQDHRE